ncbi:MAG: hypothetical protein FWC19_03420 [Treponema sp.]|nr:hypothetical protein [Treponema sp.]MCL2271840.1 hypothetical protein [Treponema sp.]
MAANATNGGMDPELAALLGTAGSSGGSLPDFHDIFGDKNKGDFADISSTSGSEVDLSASGFPPVTKRLEEKGHDFFNDPNYYKGALSNEGDIAQRVHGILQKYLTAKDPKDRSVFRQQFISPYWEFLLGIARKTTGKLPPYKKYLLRFAILHPTFLTAETRDFFSKIVVENTLDQPVYYLDEWMGAVGTSKMRPSSTDEVRVSKGNSQSKIQQLLEKAQGKYDGARSILKQKDKERSEIEKILRDRMNSVFEHNPLREMTDISDCLNEGQKMAINEIQNLLKQMQKNDHDLSISIRDFTSAEADVSNLQDKLENEGGAVTVDLGAIDAEFDTVRQMAKMTIGRQGNHFPVLTSEYYHSTPNEVGTRENIISMMARIESIDAEAFCRVYKNRLNRIAPYVLLIPTYGDMGFCWEPFDRYNRATSRGRIIVPMYPRNLYLALLTAVADLRWQVAKEKASFYWMEEGLTGHYYQWFQSNKLKGDIKEYFIRDYILWMTKEAEGIQKLEKDVRGTFWRHMPFTKEVKERLKNRSFVYQELYQRDVNRSMSDGY